MTEHKPYPVESFRDAAPLLRRPFTVEAVKFKVQATWPKDSPTGGLIVAYIDARLAVERLNLIVPDRWSDHYEPAPWLGKNFLLCHLTVDGITRSDVGQGDGKGLMSDALKRAAVKFGVGVSLYAIPKMIVNVDAQQAKHKRASGGVTLEMTPAGEQYVRGVYRLWLDNHGIDAFGEPLSHGDVEDAAGDPDELEDVAPDGQQTNGAAPVPEVVTAQDVAKLREAAGGLTAAQVKLAFGSVKLTAPEPFVPQTAFLHVPKAKAGELYVALFGIERPAVPA